MLEYLEALSDHYFGDFSAAEIRVWSEGPDRANIEFKNFASGSFSTVVAVNTVEMVDAPSG